MTPKMIFTTCLKPSSHSKFCRLHLKSNLGQSQVGYCSTVGGGPLFVDLTDSPLTKGVLLKPGSVHAGGILVAPLGEVQDIAAPVEVTRGSHAAGDEDLAFVIIREYHAVVVPSIKFPHNEVIKIKRINQATIQKIIPRLLSGRSGYLIHSLEVTLNAWTSFGLDSPPRSTSMSLHDTVKVVLLTLWVLPLLKISSMKNNISDNGFIDCFIILVSANVDNFIIN